MLLYGMPISRSTELTCAGKPNTPARNPPSAAPPRPPPDSSPGHAAGLHRSPATLAAGLRRHHLPAHPSRDTALVTLANDLPAAVLGDLLGISTTSALQWTRHAARDRNAYLVPATSSDRCEGRAGAVGACFWPPQPMLCCPVGVVGDVPVMAESLSAYAHTQSQDRTRPHRRDGGRKHGRRAHRVSRRVRCPSVTGVRHAVRQPAGRACERSHHGRERACEQQPRRGAVHHTTEPLRRG